MNPVATAYLRCPVCGGEIVPASRALSCTQCSRSFPLDNGIPVLFEQGANGMRHAIAALDAETARYTLVLVAISLLARVWLPAERRRLIDRLGLRPGDMVLDHCTGQGGNLPAIAAAIRPLGKLVAMDLSRAMVQQARKLARSKNLEVDVHQTDALRLPYADACFDAVVHYGAINQFGDGKRQAIDEMVRVTKSGGTIAILDEGIEPSKRDSWRSRLLIWRNQLFASCPPLELLPKGVDPKVEWAVGGIFYHIIFRKP